MPLRKKHPNRNKIIIAIVIVVILTLILIYFAPTIHTTEVVVFP